MLVNLIEISPEAYPLLVNHLLHHPLVHSPDQEIVYRDLRRHTSEGSGNALGFRAVAGAGCAWREASASSRGSGQSETCPTPTSARVKPIS